MKVKSTLAWRVGLHPVRRGERRRLGEFAVAEVTRFVRGEPLHGAVEAADLPRIA